MLKNTEYPKQTTQAQGCQGRVPICEFQQTAITKKDEAPCRSTNHPNLDVAGSPIDHIEEVTNTSHVSGSLFCTVLFHAFKMDTTTARQCTDTESKRAAGHCAIGFDIVFNFWERLAKTKTQVAGLPLLLGYGYGSESCVVTLEIAIFKFNMATPSGFLKF